MMHTADSDSIVRCTLQILLKFEYLGEIETAFENNLSCLSVAQMGSNGVRKSRDTAFNNK